MVRIGRIGILTLLCCSCPFVASGACAATFDITHFTDYVYMPLPGTLGASVTFDWSLYNVSDQGLSGLPGVADHTPITMSGIANLGPLLSLDAEWNPDGSIGDADYLFGKGKFELELLFNLLDGTPHTMTIRGATGPVFVSVQDDGSYPTSSEVIMDLVNAKVDPQSAALFGMKRQISGHTYYYTDTYDLDSPDRELALFGYLFFDYTPATHSAKSADLTAVPEPAVMSLMSLAIAAAIRRRRT